MLNYNKHIHSTIFNLIIWRFVWEWNFYNSDLISATKRFVTESVLKARSFMRDILASLDWENVGWKMLYNFLGNVEKHREISTYFHLKHHCGKEVGYFPCIVSKQKPHDYSPWHLIIYTLITANIYVSQNLNSLWKCEDFMMQHFLLCVILNMLFGLVLIQKLTI